MVDRDTETTATKRELKRLQEVLKEIEDQIAEAEHEVQTNKAVVTGTQSYISDEYFSVPKSFSQLVDLAGGMSGLRLAGIMYRRSLQKLKQLERLARSAYFGRIDFARRRARHNRGVGQAKQCIPSTSGCRLSLAKIPAST